MTQWASDVKDFTVSIIQNKKRLTSYSYIPKPILEMLGNPTALKFTIRGSDVLVKNLFWVVRHLTGLKN